MDRFWHQLVLGTGTPGASGPVMVHPRAPFRGPERRCEGGGQRPPRARSVARPERHEALRRIRRSRQAASPALQVGMGVDLTPGAISEAQKELKGLAESMDPQSPGSPFSSRQSASFEEKRTSAKSVRMLRRSTWDGTMEKPLARAERSHGSGNPEPREVRDSENEGRIADQPSPAEPKGDAGLTLLLRLVGVTPHFSAALAEQIQLDARLLLPELKRSEPGPSPNTVGYKPGSRRRLGKAAGASVRTGSTRSIARFH